MARARDAIESLAEDHRSLEALLDRLDSERRPAELRRLFLRIVGELSAHEGAEQEVVYPALLASVPATEPAASRRLGEHREINELLEEMRHLDPAGAGFEKRASALILELRAHFLLEEEVVFPMLRAVLSGQELAALGARIRSAKHRAPAFPSGPQRAPEHIPAR